MVSQVNGPGVGAANALDQRGIKIDKAAAVDPTPTTAVKGAEVVTLTDLAAQLQELTRSVAALPVADQEKVEALQLSISEGSYDVDPNAVAEKLTAIESLLAELPDTE